MTVVAAVVSGSIIIEVLLVIVKVELLLIAILVPSDSEASSWSPDTADDPEEVVILHVDLGLK